VGRGAWGVGQEKQKKQTSRNKHQENNKHQISMIKQTSVCIFDV
jgi:hypothetical protein